jgi:DGQHR domain-containing protein
MSEDYPIRKYSASLVTQGANKFFTLTVPSDVLARSSFVTTKEENKEHGFQRVLDQKRAKDIADYIDMKGGSIPTAVILSAQDEAEFELIDRGKTVKFKEHPNAFLILDGQHRVYGFSLSKSSIRVPVIIYKGLSRKEESRIFIDINTKQRPVPNDLLLSIKSLAEYESSSEEFLNSIFTLFHENSNSILIGLTVSAEKSRNKISRVTFYNALKPIIKNFGDKEPEEIYEVLNTYLKVWNRGLSSKNLESALTNSVVFRAIVSLFPKAARPVKDRFNEYSEHGFEEVLSPMFSKLREQRFKRPGSSHIKLLEYLEELIVSDFTL